MNKDVLNFDKLLFEVKNMLLQNVQLRKLLVHHTPDALELMVPTIEQAESFITVTPVIEEGLIVTDRNVQLVIDWANVDVDTDEDPTLYFSLCITVLCTDTCYTLSNNKTRLLGIVNEIINSLDGKKVATHRPLKDITAVAVQRLSGGKHRVGAVVKFLCGDQRKEVDF